MTLGPGQTSFSYASPLLATQAQLDTDYPNGVTYDYSISSGALGNQTESLGVPAAPL